MKAKVYVLPAELPDRLTEAAAVVIDVLRATSVMLQALENGAREIVPVGTREEALGLRAPGTLLCGERGAVKIEGFDLDNSPLAFTREAVAGKRLVMTTTNGTRALRAVRGAGTVLAGCLRNAGAVADRLRDLGGDAALVCAGTEGRLTMDDLFVAGAIVRRLGADGMDDAARLSLMLYERFAGDAHVALRDTRHYRFLERAGFARDLDHCLREGVSPRVPEYRDGLVILP